MHLDEKMISTDTVYEGRIFTITHDMVTLEDGSQADRDVPPQRRSLRCSGD